MSGFSIDQSWTQHPDVLEWGITARPGEIVSRLRKGTDRVGKVLARGATTREAVELAIGFRDAFKIWICGQ